MYGGPHKFGRGGGGGSGGKRNIFPVPPSHRPAANGRLSLGSSAPRGRTPAASTPASSAVKVAAAEETFSLVPGNSLSFAAIIRLVPDLVDEIKRVEAQGGAARIKFDSNPNNPSGNVIDVGGKEFRFTWSREMGDLCDIYEECQSGEDGNGLLVESGCPWRKLNVQRILDESTKNHVKRISEEAERKLKSRKAIVLDPGNPSMKSQAKALAAVEVSPWKAFKQKKEPPFKKQKGKPPQVSVGRPPKAVHKSGFPSTATTKGRISTSPLPSPPDRSVSLTSPSAMRNLKKGQVIAEETLPVPVTAKVNGGSSERDIPVSAFGGVQETAGFRVSQGAAAPSDLQNLLITLLKEKPNGMSIKALEKAVGDSFPSSARKVEPILKKIATVQAPGRYLLKPGVELESLKRSFSETGSSPEDNHHKMLDPRDSHGAAPVQPLLGFSEKSPAEDLEEHAVPSDSSKHGKQEKLDIQHNSPDLSGDKKASDNNEGQGGSSSDSGSDSDSDSDSSDSGSDSGSQSRSRSRSPAGSGSGISSDSDNDSSPNSKEGSDVDVDIMTSDDEKEPKHDEIVEKHDGHGSQAVEIEKDLPNDDQEAEQEAVLVSASNANAKSVEKYEHSSPYHEKHHEHQKTDVFNDRGNVVITDNSRRDQPGRTERSKGKSKRSADAKRLEETSAPKRSKTGSFAHSSVYGHQGSHFLGSPQKFSPGRFNEDPYKGPNIQMSNSYNRDENAGLQKGHNYALPGKSAVDSHQADRRDAAQPHDPETEDRSGKRADGWERGVKHKEWSTPTREGIPKRKDRVHRETQDEDRNSSEKIDRKIKESGHGTHRDSQYGKYGVPFRKFSTEEHIANSHTMSSPKANDRADADRSPVVNGRSVKLHRELSDLELGELREPLPEEPEGNMKFERNGSFKLSETKLGSSDSWNSDFGREKPVSQPNLDAGKPSSPYIRAGAPRNSDGPLKRKSPDLYTEDPLRHQRAVQSRQQNPTVSVRSLSNKSADIGQEAAEAEQIDVEGYGETHKKLHVKALHHNTKQELAPRSVKGNKSQNSNSSADASDRRRGDVLNEGCNGDHRRGDSSSDENSSYTKYQKAAPELKGPIKDFSQYREYVEEYQEKYDSYCSLNNILEGVRNEFEKLGKDLESAKGRDMERYHHLVGQLRERYHQCGPRHLRLKKIFDHKSYITGDMATVPGALIWEIVKKNNSFLVKEFGNGTAKVQFSKESNNLFNCHSYKYSGLANTKTVTIQPGGKENSVVLATTKTRKQNKPGSILHKSMMKREFRQMAKTVTNQVVDNYYRPDLKNAALARLSVVHRSLQVAKSGVKKRTRQATRIPGRKGI
ncbi:hypothetical protein Nepgr_019455 [Nepenthes gracilis]|uniref:OCEL domain-containing protein n=1 Tax=Nepenthes gracilis TaxID=150966 RepID=A0AAD3SVW7_NEPGR|nr:hypothetical protein Nepgr_019455 [Nepenthes gracilis]